MISATESTAGDVSPDTGKKLCVLGTRILQLHHRTVGRSTVRSAHGGARVLCVRAAARAGSRQSSAGPAGSGEKAGNAGFWGGVWLV